MKIVLLNVVLANGGDAAIAEAEAGVCASLYGPDVDIVVCDSLPKQMARHYPQWRFLPEPYQVLIGSKVNGRSRMWRKSVWIAWCLRLIAWRIVGPARVARRYADTSSEAGRIVYELATADHVVATGGTWLVPWYPLLDRLFTLLLAWSLHKPVMYMPQTCGPFTKYRGWWRFILRQAEHILVREERSRQELLGLGMRPSHITVVPDVAWLRTVAESDSVTPSTDSPRVLRVLVALRDWSVFPFDTTVAEGRDRYLRAVAEALTQLSHESDLHIEWCSTAQGISDYWRDDARVADEVIALLPVALQERCEVRRMYHTPTEFQQRVAKSDLVISSRMHVAILAWQVGVPVVPISNERKMDTLLVQMGATAIATHIHTVTGQSLSRALQMMIQDIDEYRRVVRLAAKKLRHTASEITDTLSVPWRVPSQTVGAMRGVRGRVMVVVPFFPQTTETFINNPLLPLREKGWSVLIVARRPANDDAVSEKLKVVYVEECSSRLSDKDTQRIVSELATLPRTTRDVLKQYWPDGALFGLAHALIQQRPDVIHCHYGHTGLAFSVICSALDISIPAITSLHGFDLSALLYRGKEVLYDHMVANTDMLYMVPSQYAKKRLMQAGFPAGKISVVTYGCDVERFIFTPRALPITNVVHIVSIGRLVPKKGFDDALRAMANVLQKFPNVRYSVIGDGEEREVLAHLSMRLGISHAVAWLGERPYTEAQNVLQTADVLLVPSKRAPDGNEEGIPLILTEGMASGIPIVTTNHSGIPELVTKHTGWVAQEGSASGLAHAIVSVITAYEWERRRIVRRARSVVERRRTLASYVDFIDVQLRVCR